MQLPYREQGHAPIPRRGQKLQLSALQVTLSELGNVQHLRWILQQNDLLFG